MHLVIVSNPIVKLALSLALSCFLTGAFSTNVLSAARTTEPPPSASNTTTYLNHLFTLLPLAANETEARQIEEEIWKSWMAQPGAEIRDLITKAMERRRWFDFEGARKILNKVVKMAPDYAEGWNQRAFILFLQEKYDQSLSDIERALALEPRHFGALAGQARILMRQGRFATGQKILKQAVKIHPFLRERSMIVEVDEPKI